MSADLITVFPSIQLETQAWDNGRKVPAKHLTDHLNFCGSTIFSYQHLKANPGLLEERQYGHVNALAAEMIDSASRPLEDFTLIFEKSLNREGLDWPESSGHRIVLYFFLLQGLDHWISPDFIKMECYEGGFRLLSHNNMSDPWITKYRYLLPFDQDNMQKMIFNTDSDAKLLPILETLSRNEPSFYERIMTSIGLFNQACRINPVDPSSSIVLLVSSFESLLQVPRYSKKDNFCFGLKLLWGLDDRVRDWAAELYEVRNQTVHGGVVPKTQLFASKHHHYPHFKIARQIYHDSLLLILERKGVVSISPKHRKTTLEQLKNMVVSNREKVENILRNKSAYTYGAFLADRSVYEDFIRKIESLTPIDYSAQELVPVLIKLIVHIQLEWIKYLEADLATGARQDDWISFLLKKYAELQSDLEELDKMATAKETSFTIDRKVSAITEHLRQIDPVWHNRDRFEFTLSEFGERVLRAFFGTF
jgi:hypothetical protein